MSTLTPRDSKFRLPTQPTVMLVTPEMAGDWLDTRNTPLKNRMQARTVVRRYVDTMKRGEWKLTTQGLTFDTEGWVLDGQHRLAAVAISGVAQEFWVFPDQPRDTFALYDAGHKRGAAQLLHMPQRNLVAAAVRFLAVADNLYPSGGSSKATANLTNVQSLDLVRLYGVKLEEAVRLAHAVRHHTKIPAAAHAAVLYQALVSPHAEKVEEWVRGLSTGAHLEVNDPRLKLRNAYLAPPSYRAVSTRTTAMPYALSVKSWNAFVTERRPSLLVWKPDVEPLPLVVDYTPPGPAKK